MKHLTHKVAAAVTARLSTSPEQRDRGSVTLEQVIWTLFLLGAAAAAVIFVGAAINNRTAGIN
ncbi:hypothetical protein ACQPZJ_44475 [Actinoplanes sp. CA-054009]